MAASKEHALRIRIASEHRRRNPDLALIEDLQRERASVRIENFARTVLAEAPALTSTQRLRLAAVMLEDGAASAA